MKAPVLAIAIGKSKPKGEGEPFGPEEDADTDSDGIERMDAFVDAAGWPPIPDDRKQETYDAFAALVHSCASGGMGGMGEDEE